jgi:hypothetical protein
MEATYWQHGVTVLFPAEQLEAVAALLHLKRRRVVGRPADPGDFPTKAKG